MDFDEYQKKAYSTCTPECFTDKYLDLGYLSEVGELAGKLAKRVRGDVVPDEDIMHEIGDCAWMIAVKALKLGRKLFINMDIVCSGLVDFDVHDLLKFKHEEVELKFTTLKFFCDHLGLDFKECLRKNNEKLASRKKRGVIQGNGDNR